MTRQAFFRVLMSLLLLFSQQMAMSHAMTHWNAPLEAAAQGQQDNQNDKSRTLAKDQSCNKCLVFAQFCAPLGPDAYTYAPPDAASLPVDGAAVAAAHARTILAFQSRGPPQA